MSFFGDIVNAIRRLFGGGLTYAEIELALDNRAADQSERLDWRNSIVDLMKLVNLDSGISNRARLAKEFGHEGPFTGTAEQNIWLHGMVIAKLRNDGVPSEKI